MKNNSPEIIITEKPGVARKTACAVCPDSPCKERNCPKQRKDVFIHHFGKVDKFKHPVPILRCRSKKIAPERLPVYFKRQSASRSVSLVYSSMVDQSGGSNIQRSIREILKDWDEPGLKRPVMEQVDWYFIQNGFKKRNWIIIHTNGNPHRLDIRKNQNINKGPKNRSLTFTSPDIQKIKPLMKHVPKHSFFGSARMRISFIRNLLDKSRESRIIVATDMDIAGTYIAATLPGFSALARKGNVKRAIFHDTTTKGIQTAISEGSDFDWHNAEAGRFRDTIDYVIGKGFYEVIKDVSFNIKTKQPFTVGRTRLLALDCLYKRWKNARFWPETGDVYLVFIGIGNKDSIVGQLNQQAFLGVALKTARGPFSPAGLLREMMIKEIGTVSTRYKLVDKLLEQGLASREKAWLFPTDKGRLVQELLIQYLEGKIFSLREWNYILNKYLVEAYKNSSKSLTEIQGKTDKLLEKFLRQFLPVLYKSVPTLSQLLKKISEMESDHPKSSKHNISKTQTKDPLEGAFNLDLFTQYIDGENNFLHVGDHVQIKRILPVPEYDWEGSLRRLLHLEREVGFQVIRGIGLEHVPHMPEGMCTVFRARCPLEELDSVLEIISKSEGYIDKLQELRVTKPEQDQELAGAHEPLGIFDISPEDIPGPEGFKVAEEYMRPYRYTLDLYKASDSKVPLLEGFNCNGLEFHRVQPFQYGTVHTFDTLLASMYDRYLMNFEDTAKIAEELYLGGREN